MTNTPHILIADDEPGMVRLIRNALTASGYRVTTVTNGAEACDVLMGADADDFAAVVLDCRMPELSGPQVVEKARRHGCRVPVLLMSGNADVADLPGSIDWPDVTILAKPFRLGHFIEAIVAMSGRAAESPLCARIGA